ncbi:putative reverse transcriptase domain-containing protein, partial [Tanacetum coccineum]
TRWFEKMETIFHISNCPPKYQVKYASCTLQNGAVTWWNCGRQGHYRSDCPKLKNQNCGNKSGNKPNEARKSLRSRRRS